MQDFTKIDTALLLIMVTAHTAGYGKASTLSEYKNRQTTISQLQTEIALRKPDLSMTRPVRKQYKLS